MACGREWAMVSKLTFVKLLGGVMFHAQNSPMMSLLSVLVHWQSSCMHQDILGFEFTTLVSESCIKVLQNLQVQEQRCCMQVYGRLKGQGLLLPDADSNRHQPAAPRKPAFVPRKRNDSKVSSMPDHCRCIQGQCRDVTQCY